MDPPVSLTTAVGGGAHLCRRSGEFGHLDGPCRQSVSANAMRKDVRRPPVSAFPQTCHTHTHTVVSAFDPLRTFASLGNLLHPPRSRSQWLSQGSLPISPPRIHWA